MATCTAMALLGRHDRDHGGIQIQHMIRYYENSMDHLIIDTPTTLEENGRKLGHWHPTQNRVDDMMLFAAVYALQDKATVDACLAAGCPEDTTKDKRWMIFDAAEKLPALYALAKEALNKSAMKVVLVRLNESALTGQMERVLDYVRDVELCPVAYDRHFCGWGNSIVETGSPKEGRP